MVQGISGNDIISAAEKYKGVPYSQRNPQSPATGFDCSGIVQQAMADLGTSIPRNTSGQLAASFTGTGINIGTNLANAQPGDIIHYVGHEEIWLGNGMVFSESTFGTTADIRPRTPWPIIGIVRYWTIASSSNGPLNLTGGSGGAPAQVTSSNINAAIDALPDVPFAIVKPIMHFIVTPVVDLANFITTIGNPGFWERVTLAFLGTIILAIGLYGMLKHKQVITVTQQMIKKGASVASTA